jgi:crossover junction endodeoxyribonuclease RuvC
MKDLILGIDPGAKGALAYYRAADATLVEMFDMPTYLVRINGSNKSRIDTHALAGVVREWKDRTAFAVIESVSSLPKQGVASTFAFGQAFMAVEMACAAMEVPYHMVTPAVWKRVMQVTGDKDEARRAASRLIPSASKTWPLVKHDGRAEAALLAVYGLRVHGSTHGIYGATKGPAPKIRGLTADTVILDDPAIEGLLS